MDLLKEDMDNSLVWIASAGLREGQSARPFYPGAFAVCASGATPSKIAVGLWGREGTAHFRRLTPPSFAAQNPPQGAEIFMDADDP
jgi:hypothetical protein